MEPTWECIVIGGGAAGLSAALVLGRARRRTLVIDAGRQSNLAAHGIGGLLGHNGRPPAELYAMGRAELAGHPTVEVRDGEVVDGSRSDDGFVVDLGVGGQEATKRILIATGMDYRMPEVPGLAERWGRSAFHCPFCHGWEVRDGRLGVLDSGPHAVRRALLLRNWTDDVTLYTNGPVQFDAGEQDALVAAGVRVETRSVAALTGSAPDLDAVLLDDGTELACEGLLVAVALHQRSDLAGRLGAEATAPTPVVADALGVDGMQQTSAVGVFAAGDVASQMPSVAAAIAAGSLAAAGVVSSLLPV